MMTPAEKIPANKKDEKLWAYIKASELSLNDEFLKHTCKSSRELAFKADLHTAIIKKTGNFWRPRLDPSFDDAGNICFKFGNKPAIDKSSNWWNTNVKHFKPEHNCRLGTKSEYIAFLGILIKTLVSEGWPVDVAWNAVCNDSKELGHYLNSVDAKRNIELTGSRKIAGFYDLGNTCKILACDEDEKSFLFAGGRYTCDSNRFPLADLCYDEFSRYAICGSVGWIVHS